MLAQRPSGGDGQAAWRGHYHVVMAITLLDGVGLGALLPVLPFLLMHFGARPAVVAQLVGLYALASFLTNPVIGHLSDRFGRTRVVSASLLGSSISLAGMLLTWSLPGVFAFRLFGGVASGRGSVLRAQLTDALPPEDHVRPLSSLATASSVGIVGGPVAAAAVASLFRGQALQYRAILILALTCCLVSFAAYSLTFRGRRTTAVRPETLRRPRAANLKTAWAIRVPLALTVATATAQGVVFSTTALLAHQRFGWGVRETGWLLASQALIAVVNRALLMQPVVRWLGLRRAYAGASAIAIPALWGVAFSRDAFSYVAWMALFAIGYSMANVLPVAMVSRASDAAARGFSLGLQQGVVAGTLAIVASASGALFQFVWSGAPHIAASAVMLFALVGMGLGALPQRIKAAPSDAATSQS